mmetsp:Transcript_40869/g.89028  ORF Transcript_40869/g.89028 Transcript_40869/m.89028 type:complete len:224 (-) Transcript_40869:7-678(-)
MRAFPSGRLVPPHRRGPVPTRDRPADGSPTGCQTDGCTSGLDHDGGVGGLHVVHRQIGDVTQAVGGLAEPRVVDGENTAATAPRQQHPVTPIAHVGHQPRALLDLSADVGLADLPEPIEAGGTVGVHAGPHDEAPGCVAPVGCEPVIQCPGCHVHPLALEDHAHAGHGASSGTDGIRRAGSQLLGPPPRIALLIGLPARRGGNSSSEDTHGMWCIAGVLVTNA